MKLFNKTAIALTLSLIGAASSVSALAMATDKTELHKISIEIDSDTHENANVFVSVDGDVTTLDVPTSALNDPQELEIILADLPDNIREKIIVNLTDIKLNEGKFRVLVAGAEHEQLHFISKELTESLTDGEHHIKIISEGGGNKVIVMDFDNEELTGGNMHQVIKKMMLPSIINSTHNNVKFIHKGQMTADSLIRMVKHSEFTADELNKIQQALDAKR
ncbi:MAG: hypothetical protein HRT53_11750 [Colwellia sp.]|nr:hypothetical protein [Colwellia sp.]